MYPAIADVLALPEVAAGLPAVRAGRGALGIAVRWVHVSELANPAGTLPDGSLVLSIGVVAADATTDPAEYLAALSGAGAVGLVVELGQQVRELPDALVQAARALGFPLVALRRSVRFAAITQAVLGRILHAEHARTGAVHRIEELFWSLVVDRAQVHRVLVAAAELIGHPVVLEDRRHRLLDMAGQPVAATLRDWAQRSRQVTDAAGGGPEGWGVRPVGPTATQWGRLVLPTRMVPDTTELDPRIVLDRAAAAVSVLVTGHDDPAAAVGRVARQRLLDDVRGAVRADSAALLARIRAHGGHDRPGTEDWQVIVIVAAPDAADRLRAVLDPHGITGLLSSELPTGAATPALLLADPDPRRADEIVEAMPQHLVVASGAAGPVPFDALPDAIQEALFVAAVRPAAPARGPFGTPDPGRLRRGSDLGARGLVRELAGHAALARYVDDQLGAVLGLPPDRRDRTMVGLRAYLAADGVVAEFARRIGVSRPAAYSRVATLSTLTGTDLTNPEVRLSLHLALMAWEQQA